MNSLKDRVLRNLEKRRENILKGGINCIPSPFKRFREDFPGLEKGNSLIVTSFTKGGKSQFCSYTFIFEPLMYVYYKKPDIKLTVIYFPLEETDERIFERFISYLLFRYTDGKIRISPKDLRSVDREKPVPEEVLEILKTEEVQKILDFFEENVIISGESNPTGIYKTLRKYAEEHGTVHKKPGHYKDEFGNTRNTDVFDYYEPDNPNEYVVPIIDTINLIDTERGMNLKQSMDKMSEYLTKYIRNRYNFCPVIIQQQSVDAESNEAYKLNRIRPSVYSLGDSKYTSRDATVTLGLFSPFRFGLREYLGYDITMFKDRIRFLEVITNREGQMGGIVALYFDGACCQFRELPPPNDTAGIQQWYAYMKKLDSKPSFVHVAVTKLIKKTFALFHFNK